MATDTTAEDSYFDSPAEALKYVQGVMLDGDLGGAEDILAASALDWPDHFEINLNFATFPLKYGDNAVALQRLEAIFKKFSSKPQMYVTLARVQGNLYLWKESRATLQMLLKKFPKLREKEERRYTITNALLRAQEFVIHSQLQQDYGAIVINLDHDTARLARAEKWYSDVHFAVERLGGVRGRYLPEYARRAIVGPKRSLGPGTLGCFLSHLAAWERCASMEADVALILEDDARPLIWMPRTLDILSLPAGFDICFVNKRMTLPQKLVREGEEIFSYATLSEVMENRPADQRGAGFDGYFLSKDGAKKMLASIDCDGLLGHVDMQVIASGLTKSECAILESRGRFFADIKRYNGRRVSDVALSAYCMWPPLVDQHDHGFSTHRSENIKPA